MGVPPVSPGGTVGYECSFKILLIGDSGVGKSSLLVSFVAAASLDDDIAPTIGTFSFTSSTPLRSSVLRRTKPMAASLCLLYVVDCDTRVNCSCRFCYESPAQLIHANATPWGDPPSVVSSASSGRTWSIPPILVDEPVSF
jgi:hypothetical protein